MGKRYEAIDGEFREILKEALIMKLYDETAKSTEGELTRFVVKLQDLQFETLMTREEVEKAMSYAIDLAEEMKNIVNDGMTKEKFEELVEKCNTDGEVVKTLRVYRDIETPRMEEILTELEELRLVGGAYAAIIAGSELKRSFYVMFHALLDQLDDPNAYATVVYFLVRSIMRMHSDEVE